MGTFVWRLFIITFIFTAGLLVGNIVAPKQVLQEKNIISISKVQTSLDLDKEDDANALFNSQNIKEIYLAFLRQNYQRTKFEYEYQLQILNNNPQTQKDFIKVQKNYLTLVNYIEQNFPPKKEDSSSENDFESLKSTQTPTEDYSIQIK